METLNAIRKTPVSILFFMAMSLCLLSGCGGYIGRPAVGILAISITSLPNGDFGVPYSTTLASTGGTAPYIWSIATGAVPVGMTLSSAGLLAGSPSSNGTFNFTIQVADSGAFQQISTLPYSMTVGSQLSIATTSLSNATVSSAFSATLSAKGGVGSDSWSLASGSTLPGGLTLSSTGVLSGKATTAGTFTFTVQAMDAFVPAQVASKQMSLIVLPAAVLKIVTSSLPSAFQGSPFSATLLSTGGTQPISWSVAAGTSLPSGLVLDPATGALTGTPKSSGSFPFTVVASDVGTPQQSVTQGLTLTVNPPAPLVMTTANLPGGALSASYSATLTATGGVAPLSWNVSAGSLPAGLSLNSATGLISGTPSSVGIASFAIQLTDSASPVNQLTKAFSITINASLGSAVNNAELNGSYAFLFNGFNNGSVSGKVYGIATIGSFNADGNGNISGVEDFNNASGSQLQVNITGQYAIGKDNRGILVINNGTSLTTFAVVAGSVTGGVAQKLRFIQFDDSDASNITGATGSGIAKIQTASAFSANTVHGSFVFGLQGETPCNTCAAPATPYGPVVAVGLLAGDGAGNLSGQEDAGAFGQSYGGVTMSGSYTVPSVSAGRGTLTMATAGNLFPAAPAGFVYYIVNANEMLVMSTDSHATTTLLSGDMQMQQQPSFTTASPTGVLIAYESSANGGDGVTQLPGGTNASLEMLTISASGSGSLSQDVNQLGAFSSPAAVPVTYTVSANGRMPLVVAGKSGPVIYLYNAGYGFGVDLPQGGETPGLITMEQQNITNVFPTFLTGTYSVSTLPIPIAATVQSGLMTLTANTGGISTSVAANGYGSTVLDSSAQTGMLTTGAASALAYSESFTGRTTISLSGSTVASSIAYAISPSKAVQISTGPGNTPIVSVLEK